MAGPSRRAVGWTRQFDVICLDDAGAQTNAVIGNIESVLAALGGGINDVVSTTMYYLYARISTRSSKRDAHDFLLQTDPL